MFYPSRHSRWGLVEPELMDAREVMLFFFLHDYNRHLTNVPVYSVLPLLHISVKGCLVRDFILDACITLFPPLGGAFPLE